MATKAHKLLTGTDLHESKGVATAISGQVYIADGAGSGAWTTINTGIQFSTGDVKFTYKTTPDAGWLLPVDGQTIGNTASGASYADSTLYSALYQLIWNNVSNTYAPVSGGRGGSAAADFAANKKITFPAVMSRAIGVAGAGTSLTARTLGQTLGAETFTILTANLPPYTPAGTIVTTVTPSQNVLQNVGGNSITPPGTLQFVQTNALVTTFPAVSTFTGTAQGGTSTAISTFEPTVFLNLMIKY